MSDRPSEPTIDELAARARAGEESAFAELVSRTQQRAYALAFRLLTDDAEARDVTQMSFIRVWENLHLYDQSLRFEPWHFRIVSNLALDRIRARKRWRGILRRSEEVTDSELSASSDPTDLHANAELASIIRSIAETLSKKQRLVFVLRDLENCSVAEVSSILQMSQESVKSNLHYARKKIIDVLQREYGIRKERA